MNLKMSQSVVILRDVPHAKIPSVLSQAKLFVLPSREEPFGIVLLEAGLAGVPIVASKVGGVPSIIRDKETGILVEPENVQDLADAIEEQLLFPENGLERAELFKEQVLRDYDWQNGYSRYLDLIEG